jgi:2-oxoglutarate dehydrogenase E1 component
MIAAMPTTPASYFHLLRRQAYDRPRRPLIVFTPKSMLRLRAATSDVEEFTTGTFQPIIGDTIDPTGVDRVLMCSGKIYYDLVAEREKRGDTATAIVRFEQLYPLDEDAIHAALEPYHEADHLWVQEEPLNQGPWGFITTSLPQIVTHVIKVVSRPRSASTASGLSSRHAAEQVDLVARAFDR